MIRIDEIYNNTFWPWFQKHLPGVRILACDPPGRSDPDSVIDFGKHNVAEHNYILFFDQEPIHLNIHSGTFDHVKNLNSYLPNKSAGAICTSEKDSENVDALCSKYQWKSYYYFFHGWAALDWYRGYDRTFLIQPWAERKISKTFIAPNRIIAGERQHRLQILYHIFKNKLGHNHISCPAVCPAENISILDAVTGLENKYPDIKNIFAAEPLPINFQGETGHPMHSCWLSLFNESAESLLYLVTETVATGRRYHLTEKTFKPIAMGMPFIIVGTKGSLKYLRSYGFRTFESIWDESYDDLEDHERIEKIAELLKHLDDLPIEAKQEMFEAAHEIIEHNWNHFYKGGFESVLWDELMSMLKDMNAESCV
jgi:hypothetical protein